MHRFSLVAQERIGSLSWVVKESAGLPRPEGETFDLRSRPTTPDYTIEWISHLGVVVSSSIQLGA
jgi:hypothetical protein